jgi:hypothetical protein
MNVFQPVNTFSCPIFELVIDATAPLASNIFRNKSLEAFQNTKYRRLDVNDHFGRLPKTYNLSRKKK